VYGLYGLTEEEIKLWKALKKLRLQKMFNFCIKGERHGKTMTKSKLVAKVSEKVGITKKAAVELIQ